MNLADIGIKFCVSMRTLELAQKLAEPRPYRGRTPTGVVSSLAQGARGLSESCRGGTLPLLRVLSRNRDVRGVFRKLEGIFALSHDTDERSVALSIHKARYQALKAVSIIFLSTFGVFQLGEIVIVSR